MEWTALYLVLAAAVGPVLCGAGKQNNQDFDSLINYGYQSEYVPPTPTVYTGRGSHRPSSPSPWDPNPALTPSTWGSTPLSPLLAQTSSPPVRTAAGPSLMAEADDYDVIHKQKAVALNGNVEGYTPQGSLVTVDGRKYTFTVQEYMKEDECIKLVTIYLGGELWDYVKISCEHDTPDRARGWGLHFDGVLYEDRVGGMKYVVRGGNCLERKKMYVGGGLKYTDTVMSEEDCDKLTGRSRSDRLNGLFPFPHQLTTEDYDVMRDQGVAIMDFSMKKFTPKGKAQLFRTASYDVQVQEFYHLMCKEEMCQRMCVKVVSFNRDDHDQFMDRVAVSCKMTEPIETTDNDYEFNFGNVFFLEDGITATFVTKDGLCARRFYYLLWDEVQRKAQEITSQDCYQLTRLNTQERRTATKNDKRRTREVVPGLMKVLSMDADVKGFTRRRTMFYMPANDFPPRVISATLHDYDYGEDQCVRVMVLRLGGAEADQIKLSCGKARGLVAQYSSRKNHVQYRRGFTVDMEADALHFTALYNLGNRCVRRTYALQQQARGGYTATKTSDKTDSSQSCRDLKGWKIDPDKVSTNYITMANMNDAEYVINTGLSSSTDWQSEGTDSSIFVDNSGTVFHNNWNNNNNQGSIIGTGNGEVNIDMDTYNNDNLDARPGSFNVQPSTPPPTSNPFKRLYNFLAKLFSRLLKKQ